MEELLNLAICDPIDFEERIFLCWLEGKTPDEAMEIKIEIYRQSMKASFHRRSRSNSEV